MPQMDISTYLEVMTNLVVFFFIFFTFFVLHVRPFLKHVLMESIIYRNFLIKAKLLIVAQNKTNLFYKLKGKDF